MENLAFGNKGDEADGVDVILIEGFFLLHEFFFGTVLFSFAFLLQLKDYRTYRFIIKK
ncbi:MAG: hypothetical protein JWQ57_2675 [Mucilaginibacter sp.]|nr:hypothetical protein [Mucilaginibacter sp.]